MSELVNRAAVDWFDNLRRAEWLYPYIQGGLQLGAPGLPGSLAESSLQAFPKRSHQLPKLRGPSGRPYPQQCTQQNTTESPQALASLQTLEFGQAARTCPYRQSPSTCCALLVLSTLPQRLCDPQVAGSPMSDSDMPKMVMFGHDAWQHHFSRPRILIEHYDS